jgi:hypothetical protein
VLDAGAASDGLKLSDLKIISENALDLQKLK